MRTDYYKLVRDRIPEIIEREGLVCAVTTLDDDTFRDALRAKLVEEASEAAEATADALVTEVADLYEVIDALLAIEGVDPEDVRAIQALRRRDRGSFNQRILLHWTDEPSAVR